MNQNSVTIHLLQPIPFGSETIHTVTIRPPKAKDFTGIDFGKLAHGEMVRKLLSRLSGLPDAALAEMDANDFFKCMEATFDFLDASRGTTRTAWDSSPSSTTSNPVSLPNSLPTTLTSGSANLSESEHIET